MYMHYTMDKILLQEDGRIRRTAGSRRRERREKQDAAQRVRHFR